MMSSSFSLVFFLCLSSFGYLIGPLQAAESMEMIWSNNSARNHYLRSSNPQTIYYVIRSSVKRERQSVIYGALGAIQKQTGVTFLHRCDEKDYVTITTNRFCRNGSTKCFNIDPLLINKVIQKAFDGIKKILSAIRQLLTEIMKISREIMNKMKSIIEKTRHVLQLIIDILKNSIKNMQDFDNFIKKLEDLVKALEKYINEVMKILSSVEKMIREIRKKLKEIKRHLPKIKLFLRKLRTYIRSTFKLIKVMMKKLAIQQTQSVEKQHVPFPLKDVKIPKLKCPRDPTTMSTTSESTTTISTTSESTTTMSTTSEPTTTMSTTTTSESTTTTTTPEIKHNCYTYSGAPCVFPFKTNGGSHYKCINNLMGSWCATSVDDHGNYKSLGYCVADPNCQEPFTPGGEVCQTLQGSPCMFPFEHKGQYYDKCIDINNDATKSCPTKVSLKTLEGFFWGECNMNTCD